MNSRENYKNLWKLFNFYFFKILKTDSFILFYCITNSIIIINWWHQHRTYLFHRLFDFFKFHLTFHLNFDGFFTIYNFLSLDIYFYWKFLWIVLIFESSTFWIIRFFNNGWSINCLILSIDGILSLYIFIYHNWYLILFSLQILYSFYRQYVGINDRVTGTYLKSRKQIF